MKILICGDSFAADYAIKYTDACGWPNKIALLHSVTNVAQAGCGEYKIYKQLLNQNLNIYDAIIISHTSPNRIFVQTHPIHSNDLLHHSCDFLYTDVVAHNLTTMIDYYEQYFDLDYAKFVHNLIVQDILKMTEFVPTLHISHQDDNFPESVVTKHLLLFSEIWNLHQGNTNHYSDIGNEIVFSKIIDWINSTITVQG